MVELDPHREAKKKLVKTLKEAGITEGYSVGISLKGIEVRLIDDTIQEHFPKEVDGVPVNVVKMEMPKKRPIIKKR